MTEKNKHAVFRANALWEKSEKEKLQERLTDAEEELRRIKRKSLMESHQ